MSKQVTVIGTDSVGLTAVADLTQRGFDVTLFASGQEKEKLKQVEANEGFFMNGDLVLFDRFEPDLEKALTQAEYIFVTVLSDEIEALAKQCAPFLSEDQSIIMLTSASLASVRFKRSLEESDVEGDFKIGEVHASPYESVFDPETAEIELFLRVKKLLFSTYRKEDSERMLRSMRTFYPSVMEAENVWEILLNHPTPESLVVPVICNIAKLDQEDSHFHLYQNGLSNSVIRLIQEVDEERQKLCRQMGLPAKSLERRLVETGHAKPLDELLDQFTESHIFKHRSMDNLSDDLMDGLCDGLVAWSSLGSVLEVSTPTIDSLIHIASVALDRIIEQEGLTLDKVGIFKGDADSLIHRVHQEKDEEDVVALNE